MRRALAVAASAGVLLAGCALGAESVPDGPTAPGPGAVAVTPAAPVPPPLGTGAARPVEAGTPVPVRPAEAPPATPVAAPERLQLDALGGVDMPVDAVGVARDGQMEVPPDANRAGWYRFGPTVGESTGTAVVVAHSGSFITPRGPLAELHLLTAGDRVRLTRTDGHVAEYAVTGVEVLDKATIDLAAYFRRDGDPRLVLITCGGEWDEQRSSYRQNVVATATLLPDQGPADAGA